MKRKTDNFNKFYNKKRNSAVKEEFKQEKKAAKKERKEAIERHFEMKRQARGQQYAAGSPSGPYRAVQPDTSAGGKRFPGKKMPPATTLKAAGQPSAFSGKSGSTPASAQKGVAEHDPNLLPLNKYIAHGGICSRRDAAELIKLGKVLVNGHPVTEPGTKVSPDDLVKVNGKKVTISRNFVYILLNKPKDYITTTDDPQGRRTVLDLIRQATLERVYPVGRLDRNTSGVLLLTNDGDLAQKLAHPKHEIKKIYHVSLDKALTKADFDKIISGGVMLEDGEAHVDVLAYADPKDKTQIGLEIHSGRNRIVRRIFEHLGYDVRGLDRVMYAGLTKKNVQRGKWRLLNEKEIRILKYLNSSIRGAAQNKVTQAGKGTTPKNSREIEIDEFLSADGHSEDSDDFEAASSAGKPAFEGKKKTFGKGGFAARKTGAAPGKKDFSGKKEFEGRKEGPASGRKEFAGKKDFSDKKGFAARKTGPAYDKKESFGKKEFAGKKDFEGRKEGAPAGGKSFRSGPDKKSSSGDKGFSSDRKGFGGKKAFFDKKESGGRKEGFAAGKKEFSDKKGFAARKTGPAYDKKESFGKKEFAGKKDFEGRKEGAPAGGKSFRSGPAKKSSFGDSGFSADKRDKRPAGGGKPAGPKSRGPRNGKSRPDAGRRPSSRPSK